MQQSQSIICYQLVNAPTSLVDDLITYKSFVQRKRSSEAHAALQQQQLHASFQL
jgi:hypothetical protein